MDRLIAANETTALYVHDDLVPNPPVDAFSYINDLLSIRSARGLISFLKNHPQGLRDAAPARDLSIEASAAATHGLKSNLSFSESAMLSACSWGGIDYLDAATDLEGHNDYVSYINNLAHIMRDFYAEHPQVTSDGDAKLFEMIDQIPKADLYFINIEDLGISEMSLENILMMGLVANHVMKPEDTFEIQHHVQFDYPDDGSMAAFGSGFLCLVTVEMKWIWTMMPRPYEVTKDDIEQQLRSWFLKPGNAVLDYLPNRDTEKATFLCPDTDDSRAAELCAGDLTAFALSRWVEEFGKFHTVVNTSDKGFVHQDSSMNAVVNELCDIVVDGRFDSCRVCNRPFVVKRKPKGGKLNKLYCTESCKVKARQSQKEEGD